MEGRHFKYQRKIGFITEKMESIVPLPADLPIDAVLYRVQTSIESAADLAAMLVKDLGGSVSDDYHNLDLLVKKEIISGSLAKRLKSIHGLRNAIVHKYNTFEETEVVTSLSEIQEDLYAFLEAVEHALKKIPVAD